MSALLEVTPLYKCFIIILLLSNTFLFYLIKVLITKTLLNDYEVLITFYL